MAVFSTYCQICGLPVQQDHYVPAAEGGYFHIWRGDGDDACAPIVEFGPEHAWLRAALGLRYHEGIPEATLAGLVHDGYIEKPGGSDPFWVDVMEGDGDERAAVHAACWDLAGQPSSWEALQGLEIPQEQEEYRQQLFDFEAFVADGHGWMLVDPALDAAEGARSRQRILSLLAAAR